MSGMLQTFLIPFLRVNLLLWQQSMPRVQLLCLLPLPWGSGYGIEADCFMWVPEPQAVLAFRTALNSYQRLAGQKTVYCYLLRGDKAHFCVLLKESKTM